MALKKAVDKLRGADQRATLLCGSVMAMGSILQEYKYNIHVHLMPNTYEKNINVVVQYPQSYNEHLFYITTVMDNQ